MRPIRSQPLAVLVVSCSAFARDYEFDSGRYVESDPVGQLAGVSTYAYVESNPLGYVDPFGLKCGSGQVTVWAFTNGVPRTHCASSANPSGNFPHSNPTGEAAFLNPSTNTPKGDCQTKCTADFVLPGTGTLIGKGVDVGLGKLLWGSALTTVRTTARIMTLAYDTAAWDKCIQTCKNLDGCEQ